jgi:glutamate synthase domain-containing protein 3
MTNGTVVVLGETGRNLGAGMSGGEAYVHDPGGRLPLRFNDDLVEIWRLEGPAEALRALIERHQRYTGSAKAEALLGRWDQAVREFWHVAPKVDVAALEDEHEGTLAPKHAEAEDAVSA